MTETLTPDTIDEATQATAAPKPTLASAVKLHGIRHINQRERATYFIEATWTAPWDRNAARELVQEPIAQQLREMNLESVQRYRELVTDQAAIVSRLTMAQAVLAEEQAKRNRLTLEGRAGAAAELVKLGKAIAAAQQDIAEAEQERDSIQPLVTAAHEQARGELGRAENVAFRGRKAEIDVEHAKIVDEITSLIADRLVALKRLASAVSDLPGSVADGLLGEIQKEARK